MRAGYPKYLNIYYSLAISILAGEYRHGDKLPGREELARRFQASEITVRKALSLLAEQGYVQTHQGKAAVVALDVTAPETAARLCNLSRGQMALILDILQAYRLLLPPFLHLGMAKMGREAWKKFSAEVSRANRMDYPAFFARLTELANKHILFSTGNGGILYFFNNTKASLAPAVNIMDRGKASSLQAEMAGYIGSISSLPDRECFGDCIGAYLDRLLECVGGIPGGSAPPSFSVEGIFYRGSTRYLDVCYDLLHKIASGQYTKGELLPADERMAEKYQVAVNTIRKAYQVLSEIGFVQTKQAVGTRITFGSGILADERLIMSIEVQKRILMLLDSLQFITICIRDLALTGGSRMSRERIQTLRRGLSEYGNQPVLYRLFAGVEILDGLVESLGNSTMEAYHHLCRPQLFMGTYLISERLLPYCSSAYEHFQHAAELLELGRFAGFAGEMETTFLRIYENARQAYRSGMRRAGNQML